MLKPQAIAMDLLNKIKEIVVAEIYTRVAHVPMLLHYTSLDAFKSMLQGKELWFSRVKDMKDTSEVTEGAQIVADALEKLGPQIFRSFRYTDTAIDRLCGQDPTGTLYLGLAGTGKKSWSILRNRIIAVVNSNHHATRHWDSNDAIRQKFPAAALMVEWAYTGMTPNFLGELIHEAVMAESWLLLCYLDSFGEFPPLNERA